MGKPVKIRKKKSFMFTTRHYSFMSIMGIVLALVCILAVASMVFISYRNAGKIDIGFGGVGLFSVFLNIIGIICAVISLGERDVYLSPGIVAIVINGAMILAWVAIIIISMVAK